jgi:uncharacterized protein YyaL (SSP411 family)
MARKQTTSSHANRLISETSPYLLQHAHNPVDWYPWGGEAFERAQEEDKPIFLSVGYSTCHWCHVMEHESFEDEEIAALMNRDFVAIKVDREERPDIDETYMKAVQMMTGMGGWPLSVFLTPDGKPFYGGTYFPPRSIFGRPGFLPVLRTIAQAWRKRRNALLESAQALTEVLGRPVKAGPEETLAPELLRNAFAILSEHFDHVHGGLDEVPKFPQPTMLMTLLNHWHGTGDGAALQMVEKTLQAMAGGGIHDHLGGGFHRYSTDAQWLIPHFEKMLYDQALLGRVYVEAYQATKKPIYAAAARDIFNCVLRDMTGAEGGFYAGQDADSEGREGAFYVWTREEIERILPEPQASIFCGYYGVSDEGNFEGNESVLHIAASINELARRFGPSPQKIEAELTAGRQRLFEQRNTRPRPGTDDKVIVSWNGLMLSALAYGGAVLGEPGYTHAARRAAAFILDFLRPEGRLRRYFRAGHVLEKAFLDDYAFLILGLIDLYEASFEVRWLREAKALADQMIALFADRAEGGFFVTGRDAEPLISRDKPAYDGAVPSGNSIAALVLLKLGRLLMEDQFTEEGDKVLRKFSRQLAESPTSLTAMFLALDYRLGPAQEIVIAGTVAEAQPLIDEVRRHFLPNASLLLHATDAGAEALAEVVPFTENLASVDGHATAYVCEDYACRQPVTTEGDLRRILDEIPSGR